MMIHPIFHVPHDGTQFPDELMASVCVSQDQFQWYHEKMRDCDVSQVIPYRFRNDRHCIQFPVSRLLCDVERFIGPQEIMEQYGMGYCYERAYDGQRIKRVTDRILAQTKEYYDRHHRMLDAFCQQHKNIVLFDIHSFSDDIVVRDLLIPGRRTPDVCIGTDLFFSDAMLVSVAERTFQKAGFSTALNYPYAGCLIPNCVLSGKYEGRFSGVMLEFNKRVYFRRDGHASEHSLTMLRYLVDEIINQYDAFVELS